MSPVSLEGGPEAGGGNDDRGTGGRSKLSAPGRPGGLTTPCWGAVGCRERERERERGKRESKCFSFNHNNMLRSALNTF